MLVLWLALWLRGMAWHGSVSLTGSLLLLGLFYRETAPETQRVVSADEFLKTKEFCLTGPCGTQDPMVAAQGSLPQTFNGQRTRCLWWGTKPQECCKTSARCLFCHKRGTSRRLIWWNFVGVYCARIAVRAGRHTNMHLSSASVVKHLWSNNTSGKSAVGSHWCSQDFKQMAFGEFLCLGPTAMDRSSANSFPLYHLLCHCKTHHTLLVKAYEALCFKQ